MQNPAMSSNLREAQKTWKTHVKQQSRLTLWIPKVLVPTSDTKIPDTTDTGKYCFIAIQRK